jgi:hypothetical protein
MRSWETIRWIVGGLLSLIVLLSSYAFIDLKAQVDHNTEAIEKFIEVQAVQRQMQRDLEKVTHDLDWLVKRELEHVDGHHQANSRPRGAEDER